MFEPEKFKEAYQNVKQLGFIESRRDRDTGIGKTLEDIMSIPENNIDAPDLHGIEIKSQRALSSSYVTLFTKAPTSPRAVNTRLRLNYGTFDQEFKDIKVLHVSIFGDRFVEHSGGYSFKLDVDDIQQKVFLTIKHTESSCMVEQSIYWSYEVLRNIINNKLQYLAFIKAVTQRRDNKEFFSFQECTLYSNSDFSAFLSLLSTGDIMFDIRIGAYKVGDKRGRTHDHGSGFRIKRSNLSLLYMSEENL